MLALLIAATFMVFALPFIPTAGLFLRRRDALGPPPLSEAAYAPDHFARSLIAKLRAHLMLVAQPVTAVAEYRVDGEPLLVLPASMRQAPAGCANKMSYSFGDLALPASLACHKEVACEGSLRTGEDGTYRALYAADTLHLNWNSTIIRWCHADADLEVEGNCRILGRASANKTIKIDAPCEFASMTAPTILLGHAQRGARRMLPRGVADADTVAREAITLVPGTKRRGSIKARRLLEVGAGSVIEGALVCEGGIVIGPRCAIWGPIVAEGGIRIGEGCEIGRPEAPASVVGEDVEILAPAVIHGALHASRRGVVRYK